MIAAWQAFKREAKVDFGRAGKKGSSLLLFSFTRGHAPKFLFPSLSNAYRAVYAVDYPNIIWFLQESFRRWFFIIRHLILQLCIFLGAKWETLMSVPAGRPGRRDVGLLKIPGGGLPSMAYKGSLCPKGGTSFRLQVNERVGISLVEVYEPVAKPVISVWKGLQLHFVARKKSRKRSHFVIY